MEKNPDNKPEFRLRSNIVTRRNAPPQVCVMDTKWKRLNRNDKQRYYGISQPDLYQMYAYDKKYQKTDATPDLYLFYPRNKNFYESFQYEYETGLRLTVFPRRPRQRKTC